MIEFALVLPLLLVLVAGLVEVGRALIVYAAVDRAVASGARLLARTETPGCLPTCSPGTDRVLSSITARIRAETGVAPASLKVLGPDDGVLTVESEVNLQPLVFRGWDFGIGRIAVAHREQHVAP